MTKRVAAATVAALALSAGSLTTWWGENETGALTPGRAEAATSAQGDPKAIEQVKAVMAQHDKALGQKNLQALMTTFSTSPNTVVLGTGPAERWVGPTQIKQAYTQIFKDFDVGTLVTTPEWRTGAAVGSMAYLAGTWTCSDSMKGKKRQYALNLSAALQKQSGKWRLVMVHWSNPTAP